MGILDRLFGKRKQGLSPPTPKAMDPDLGCSDDKHHKCYNHPERNASGTCHWCGRSLCKECLKIGKKHSSCKNEDECLSYQEKGVVEKQGTAALGPFGGAFDVFAQVIANPIEQAKKVSPEDIPGCHKGSGSPRVLCLLQEGKIPTDLPEWCGTVLKDKKDFPFQKDWKIYFQQFNFYPSQSSLGMYIGSHAQVFCEHHGLGTPDIDSLRYAECFHISGSKQTKTLLYSVQCKLFECKKDISSPKEIAQKKPAADAPEDRGTKKKSRETPKLAAAGEKLYSESVAGMMAGRDMTGLISSFRATKGYTDARPIADALVQFGDEAIQPLIDGLHNENPQIAHWCARTLGYLGIPDAFTPLIAALEDETKPTLQEGAVWALRELGGKQAVQALIALLAKGGEHKRLIHYAIEALGTLGDLGAADALYDAVNKWPSEKDPVKFYLEKLGTSWEEVEKKRYDRQIQDHADKIDAARILFDKLAPLNDEEKNAIAFYLSRNIERSWIEGEKEKIWNLLCASLKEHNSINEPQGSDRVIDAPSKLIRSSLEKCLFVDGFGKQFFYFHIAAKTESGNYLLLPHEPIID